MRCIHVGISKRPGGGGRGEGGGGGGTGRRVGGGKGGCHAKRLKSGFGHHRLESCGPSNGRDKMIA